MLVAAHGNSIRALRKHLEDIADDAITELEVPTGIPFRMRLDDDLTVRARPSTWATPKPRPRQPPPWPARPTSPPADAHRPTLLPAPWRPWDWTNGG